MCEPSMPQLLEAQGYDRRWKAEIVARLMIAQREQLFANSKCNEDWAVNDAFRIAVSVVREYFRNLGFVSSEQVFDEELKMPDEEYTAVMNRNFFVSDPKTDRKRMPILTMAYAMYKRMRRIDRKMGNSRLCKSYTQGCNSDDGDMDEQKGAQIKITIEVPDQAIVSNKVVNTGGSRMLKAPRIPESRDGSFTNTLRPEYNPDYLVPPYEGYKNYQRYQAPRTSRAITAPRRQSLSPIRPVIVDIPIEIAADEPECSEEQEVCEESEPCESPEEGEVEEAEGECDEDQEDESETQGEEEDAEECVVEPESESPAESEVEQEIPATESRWPKQKGFREYIPLAPQQNTIPEHPDEILGPHDFSNITMRRGVDDGDIPDLLDPNCERRSSRDMSDKGAYAKLNNIHRSVRKYFTKFE